jgi:outer membrane immunogenic protein
MIGDLVRHLIIGMLLVALLPSGAAPVIAADWTGWSIGVSGGGGKSTSTQTDSGIPCSFLADCMVKPSTASVSPARSSLGGIFGGEIGYDFWQARSWVFGVVGDYSWAGIAGGSDVCAAGIPAPHVCGTTLQSLGTFRGRIGYAPDLNWLVYGNAGYAGGSLNAWDSWEQSSGTAFLSGWSAGVGTEVLTIQNIWLKFEYLHASLGHTGVFYIAPGVRDTVSVTSDIFRVGLELKFNSLLWHL